MSAAVLSGLLGPVLMRWAAVFALLQQRLLHVWQGGRGGGGGGGGVVVGGWVGGGAVTCWVDEWDVSALESAREQGGAGRGRCWVTRGAEQGPACSQCVGEAAIQPRGAASLCPYNSVLCVRVSACPC